MVHGLGQELLGLLQDQLPEIHALWLGLQHGDEDGSDPVVFAAVSIETPGHQFVPGEAA